MLTVVVLLSAFFISGSHQQCFTTNDTVNPLKLEQYTQYVRSHRSFCLSLLKTLNKDNTRENILFSPYSIENVLLLAYFGAARETEAALAHILYLSYRQSKPKTYQLYRNHRSLVDQKDKASNLLNAANKIFFSKKINLRRCFAEKFEDEMGFLDYQKDAVLSLNYINLWVNIQTNGQIKDLIKNVTPDTRATLVSAAYLKARWLNEFNPSETRQVPFHVKANETTTTTMMVKRGYFVNGYLKQLQARLVLLPYQEKRTSMVIILPDNDLDTTINSMSEPLLSYIITKRFYKTSYFELYIPKFENKNRINMSSVLDKLGNTLTEEADFSGFTGRNEVFFDDMVHEAKIEVDEEGDKVARQAGGTAEPKSTSLLSDPFKCDRPFAYIIYDFFSSKILLMGTFREPNHE